MRFRGIAQDDWPAIAALESAAYLEHGLSESVRVLRLRAWFPATCFVIEACHEVVGYSIALPYPFGSFPDLRRSENDRRGPVDERSDNLHWHDIVIAPEHRNRGVLRAFAPHLTTVARKLGFRRISLVSVLDNEERWSRLGFRTRGDIPVGGGYGAQGVYMTQVIEAIRTHPATAPSKGLTCRAHQSSTAGP